MLSEEFSQKLQTLGLSQTEFSELLIRLLDYGVICRDESQIEAGLYDRYLQCSELVEDYLQIIGIRIQHDAKFCFIRLYPPGATVPGLQDEEHSPFNQGFRHRPSQVEMAVILVLRVEYEKSLREGLVDDKGCVLLSLEGLAISLKNLLKRNLPEAQIERKQLFRSLRQLRLIRYNSDSNLDSEDSWISIQPSISSFVSTEVLQQLYPEAETENQGQIDDASQTSKGASN